MIHVHAVAEKSIKNVMEYKNLQKKIDKFSYKAIQVLAGFLGSLLITILLLKLSNSFYGIIGGLVISIAYGFFIFKKKIRRQYLVAKGVLGSAIFIIAAGLIIWVTISMAFQDIAN